MKISLSFFFLSLCHTFLLAQGDFRPGYIITNSNDSTLGFIDYRGGRNSSQVCVFKPTKRSKKIEYTPDQIKAYGLRDDKRFVSKQAPSINEGENVFMEQQLAGKMSLFSYRSKFYVETDSLFLLPTRTRKVVETAEGTKIRTNHPHIGILNYLLFDCGLSANKTEYKERDLTNLIQNYNRCKGGAGKIFKQKLPYTRFNFQLFSGYDNSTLEIDVLDHFRFKPSTSPIFGAGMDISSPRLFDRLFLSLEAIYTDKIFQAAYREIKSSTIYHYDYLITVSHLKFPVGVRYNFLREPNTPYFKFGLTKYLNMYPFFSLLTEEELNGVVKTSYSSQPILNIKSQITYWAALGLNMKALGKFKGFAEVRYESGAGFFGIYSVNGSLSSSRCVNLILGIRY